MEKYSFINIKENIPKLNQRKFIAMYGMKNYWYAYKLIAGYRIEVRSDGGFAFWRADFNGLDYDYYNKDEAIKYIDGLVLDGILERL